MRGQISSLCSLKNTGSARSYPVTGIRSLTARPKDGKRCGGCAKTTCADDVCIKDGQIRCQAVPIHPKTNRDTSIIICTQQDGTRQQVTPPSKILAKLLKWTVHTLEIYWWDEDYCGSNDVELEDVESPLWSVHVEYSNGEIQDMRSADNLPDSALELLFALAELFE